MSLPRPTYTGIPANVNYALPFTLNVTLPANTTNVSGASAFNSIRDALLIPYLFNTLVVIIDPGFATHGVHMDQRAVKLVSVLSADQNTLIVTGPPNNKIYPPGKSLLLTHSMYNNQHSFIIP
jgi:hypothetical protein